MSTATAITLSAATIAGLVLAGAGTLLLVKGIDRKRGALMIGAGLVIVGNVLILAV